MMTIDETCITNLVRDELGTWYGKASYDGTTVDCSWDADTPEEHDDERRFAVLNVLDNLRVCTVRDRIAEGRDITLTDGDVVHAIRAAERIGDDDIEGLLGHAWCRGLLTDKGLTTDQVVIDISEATNVVSLGDHRQPVHYRIGIVHHYDGTVQTYVADVDLSTMRSRLAIADGLKALVAKLEDENRSFTLMGSSEVPA